MTKYTARGTIYDRTGKQTPARVTFYDNARNARTIVRALRLLELRAPVGGRVELVSID